MTDLLDPPDPSTRVDRRRSSEPPEMVVPSRGRNGPGRWWYDGFRPLLLRLHFYVGLFVGPFILVAATTGLCYILTPQLERVVESQALIVPVGGQVVPLADQVRAAQATVADGELSSVRPQRTSDGTTRVTFATPDDPDDYATTAFVDPYTGKVTAVLPTYGEWLPLRSWFDTLHRTLMLGNVGRVYSELAASWLWVLALSGLSIWVVRARRRRRLRRTLLPELSGRGRGRLMTWHGTIGLWVAIGMLFLSVTGLTWSQFAGGNVSTLRKEFNWIAPSVTTTPPVGTTVAPIPPGQQGAAVERALDAARAAGLDGPVQVSVGDEGSAWKVQQVQRSWPTKQDTIAVDPASGEILDRVDFADWPVAAKLARWGIDGHMGLLFGVVNQVILVALAAGIICLVVWGYRMWWLRRPTRADRAGELAAPLGANQRPSQVAVITVALLGVGVGIFFPVLGASLLLFLTGDVVYTSIRHRRERSRTGVDTKPS